MCPPFRDVCVYICASVCVSKKEEGYVLNKEKPAAGGALESCVLPPTQPLKNTDAQVNITRLLGWGKTWGDYTYAFLDSKSHVLFQSWSSFATSEHMISLSAFGGVPHAVLESCSNS